MNSNTSAISAEATTRANADSALASEINTVQSALKDANGNLISSASVQTTANTALSNANQALASWTVKVDTNSAGKQYVGGLELVSGGSSGTQFAISADQLVLYMPDGTIPAGQTGPVPVMEVAAVNGVNTLGFNGALIVDGSISARSINSNNLTIRDGSGNIILGAGTPLSLGNISGLGAFASLGQISPSNASTYIASGAIGSAEIGNAAVETLSIDGNAVTVPDYSEVWFITMTGPPYIQSYPNWTTLCSYTTQPILGLGVNETVPLLIVAVFQIYGYGNAQNTYEMATAVDSVQYSLNQVVFSQTFVEVTTMAKAIVGSGTHQIEFQIQVPSGTKNPNVPINGVVQAFSLAVKR